MKLRCVHNSIRIRVKKSDLALLKAKGRIVENISFGPKSHLSFEIKTDKNFNNVKAEFSNSVISIVLPESIALAWITNNEVGIEVQQALSGNDSLHILLEKDFPCGDREGEDKADTFWELVQNKVENC